MRCILPVLLLMQAGCGLTPVYGASRTGTGAGGGGDFSIQIEGGHQTASYELRQSLRQNLVHGLPGQNGLARLQIRLHENFERLTYERDRSVSRTLYRLEARWEWIGADGESLWSGRDHAETGFLAESSVQADIGAQTDARLRAAQMLARRLWQQILVRSGP